MSHNSTNHKDTGAFTVKGHIKIYDPKTGEVYRDQPNAIHYENFSIALAASTSNQGHSFISEMCFGNGGTRIDDTGIITYLTPNVVDGSASLYNQTYIKGVDSNQPGALNPTRNYMEIRHVAGSYYTDIVVSCLLDLGEPADQDAFDTAANTKGNYVFDEIGLRGYSPDGPGAGLLLTHVIFHPVQKSLNRLIQIDYTVRVQSLTA
jgi:hypothetical protein